MVYIEELLCINSATTPSCTHFNDDTKLLETSLHVHIPNNFIEQIEHLVKGSKYQTVFSFLSNLQENALFTHCEKLT